MSYEQARALQYVISITCKDEPVVYQIGNGEYVVLVRGRYFWGPDDWAIYQAEKQGKCTKEVLSCSQVNKVQKQLSCKTSKKLHTQVTTNLVKYSPSNISKPMN